MIKDKESFIKLYMEKFEEITGKALEDGNDVEKYKALAALVRDYIIPYWVNTNIDYKKKDEKQVYYFSIEFLLGRLLRSYIMNLEIEQIIKEGLKELGISLEELEKQERDAGLGNGGLGRLAACFLDSMSSNEIAGHGCGIRYKYGLFEQKIIEGHQVEIPDNWLKYGNVWEVKKPDRAVVVKYFGNIRMEEEDGRVNFIHENYEPVLAVPYDMPIVGKDKRVNTLRLFGAEPLMEQFDFSFFNRGDYLKAVSYKNSVEAITEILYPNDTNYEGKLLRLKQQYFLTCAGINTLLASFKKRNKNLMDIPKYIAVHINDTHPAICIPELMRVLIDEEGLGWEEAWHITTNTISYTNHTILPEALETWPIDLFKTLLPRIFMIIEEIDRRNRDCLTEKYYDNEDKIKKMTIIDDGVVKMAHLAILGSYSVNGVAKVHSNILKNQVMREFYEEDPRKFNNKTNGVSHRRFLIKSNQVLAGLIDEKIGREWRQEPSYMIDLVRHIDDPSLRDKVHEIKKANKVRLAKSIYDSQGIKIDPNSIFDVQVKRIHAYKRQFLNIMHVMDLYNQLKENPSLDIVPRTFIFSGKAAPSYYLAKKIIRLINSVGKNVNTDKRIKDKLKVVFIENFNVSKAEMIYPAADVSEQISTASKEASGTGNMKFMMNGAITLGTMDGANIEIYDLVGLENIFIFGLKADEVLRYYSYGGYNAWEEYHKNERIKFIFDEMMHNCFEKDNNEFEDIFNSIMHQNDQYFVLRDYASYVGAQKEIDQRYRNKSRWAKMALNNIAHSGYFSSDRTIKEYAKYIWKV